MNDFNEKTKNGSSCTKNGKDLTESELAAIYNKILVYDSFSLPTWKHHATNKTRTIPAGQTAFHRATFYPSVMYYEQLTVSD